MVRVCRRSATAPLASTYTRDMNIFLRTSQAIVDGDELNRIRGLTDTQVTYTYFVRKYNVALNMGINMPTGKEELTPEEFRTSVLISQNIYDFQVPNYGQGWNFTPGVTWAHPLSDDLVLGLGVSYQYKGKFKSLDTIDDFNPGDEVLISGGVDVRLSKSATFSSDVIFINYGTDRIGSEEIFDTGNKIIVHARVRKYIRHNELSLLARYRSRARNHIAAASGLIPDEKTITPDQFDVQGLYRIHVNRRFELTISGEGRFYHELYEHNRQTYDGMYIYEFGAAPEFVFLSDMKLSILFSYLTGGFKDGLNISGWELGVGLRTDL